MLLTDQISFSDCLYFLRYYFLRAIFILDQKNKNTLVSQNAGNGKNLHPGGCKFIFVIGFPETFSFLLDFKMKPRITYI